MPGEHLETVMNLIDKTNSILDSVLESVSTAISVTHLNNPGLGLYRFRVVRLFLVSRGANLFARELGIGGVPFINVNRWTQGRIFLVCLATSPLGFAFCGICIYSESVKRPFGWDLGLWIFLFTVVVLAFACVTFHVPKFGLEPFEHPSVMSSSR